jgi:hypothetical protein
MVHLAHSNDYWLRRVLTFYTSQHHSNIKCIICYMVLYVTCGNLSNDTSYEPSLQILPLQFVLVRWLYSTPPQFMLTIEPRTVIILWACGSISFKLIYIYVFRASILGATPYHIYLLGICSREVTNIGMSTWVGLIWLLLLNKCMYSSGVWLDVDLRLDIKKMCVQTYWTTCSKFLNHSNF